MFSKDQRPDRQRGRQQRTDRGLARLNLEALETRQLMAYSAFGFSLPQLSVTGYAAPQAAYGGTLAVEIDVENQGASSLIEPLNLAPASVSTADAAATTVQIFASSTPNAKSGYVLLGTVDIPIVRQNSDYETVAALALPSRPASLPKTGNIYLTLAVNNNQAILQTNSSGNVYHIAKPVQIVSNDLPDLQVVGFDIPSPLQPGDTIAPTIQIENFGVGDSGAQGPVTVALVASLDKKFGVGDAVVSSFVIPSLPGVSAVPTQTTISAEQNLFPTPNEYTITLPAFQLPTTPGFYYLGIKIDPTHQINQTYGPTNKLVDPVPVGPANQFLAPSTVLVGAIAPVFPALPAVFINTTGAYTTPIITPITTTSVAASSVSPTTAKAAKAAKRHHS